MKKRKKVKVMVFGTFDVLHPGHLSFLKQARALGDFLVVSVSRNENAKRFKGHYPLFKEKERLLLVGSLKFVNKAILGDKNYYLGHTLKENPDIIALGYDQKAFVNHLKADIDAGKLKVKLVRLKPYNTRKFKSTNYRNLIKNNR